MKRTPVRVSEAMFGFAVIVPCAIRERMSSEIVGWASPKRWSGFGSP